MKFSLRLVPEEDALLSRLRGGFSRSEYVRKLIYQDAMERGFVPTFTGAAYAAEYRCGRPSQQMRAYRIATTSKTSEVSDTSPPDRLADRRRVAQASADRRRIARGSV